VRSRSRPIGGGYPPTPTDAAPEGYIIEYNLGILGTLQFNVNVELSLDQYPGYFRYMGKILGGQTGEEAFEGRAFGEQLVD
jgi:hypothetical protein